MPKHGFLTPKAIGNRIKAKGLQKLRWYCEMCQKQCRDENGFKCHQTSEGHLRQMRIFAENPEAVMKEVGAAGLESCTDILLSSRVFFVLFFIYWWNTTAGSLTVNTVVLYCLSYC